MRIAPIGINFGYYTNPYTSSTTKAAARTALADKLHEGSVIQPVDAVPEVFSNDEVDRVSRSPEELSKKRQTAYEIMNSQTPRDAEHLNPAQTFPANTPVQGTSTAEPEKSSAAEEFDLFGDGKTPKGIDDDQKCETCENRTYVDGSNESDVSFKAPGHIAPEAAASRVMAHEYEHVRNAYQEDKKEGKELVSVSVSLKTAICPECGKTYVAGGETRTTMRTGAESAYQTQMQAYNAFAGGNASQIDTAA